MSLADMSSDDELHLDIQLTRKDHLNAYRRLLWRKLALVQAACLAVICFEIRKDILGNLRELRFATPEVQWDLLLLFFLIFLCIVVILILPEIAARWATRRALRTTPSALDPAQIIISADGMKFSGPKGSSSVKWIAFYRGSQTATAFQFYLSADIFVLLPYRCFSSLEDRNKLRAIANEQLGKKARKLAPEPVTSS